MGNQKEFIQQVERLKKDFDFAATLAININADRLRHLDTIGELTNTIRKYKRVLENIAMQKTCEELGDSADDADYEGAYDIMIKLARGVLKTKTTDNATT